MFLHARKGHVEPLGKGCDRSVRTPELLQNAASGGVRERAERGIEVGVAILSHTVQYIWVTACNGRWAPAQTGVRYSLNRIGGGFGGSPPAGFHSLPIIRTACRRPRRWVRRALADIPPRQSHPRTAASPATRRSANAAQAPASRARMNSGT